MIYHVADKAIWLAAKQKGKYEPESLEIEGFIHCCTKELFPQVTNFYFKGRTDIVLLEIDEDKLAMPLVWDDVGEHKFPHIYGPLEVFAVVQEADLRPNKQGLFEFPFVQVLH
jgi:uncharacterized protein (DUF952 family)